MAMSLAQVTGAVASAEEGTSDGNGIYVPVARERAQQLRDMLLANATGLRRTT